MRSLLLATLLLPAVLVAQDDPPSKLPIDVPERAVISFEAEGTGKQFIPVIKRLLSADPGDFRSHPSNKVSVKTPFGDVDLSIDDLAPLIEQVHALHVVAYTGGGKEDPFKVQEKRMTEAGLKRVALAPGSDGPLVMQKHGRPEQYGIVARYKGSVVILRTEGGPNLGDFGRVAYETLAQLVQQNVKPKKHH